jgi:murein tripeptide amidase MpaA
MEIDSQLDCGNIEVVSLTETQVHLAIRPDTKATFFQWFYFRVKGGSAHPIEFIIDNAGQSTYAHAWPGSQTYASGDGEHWQRIETGFDGQALHFVDTPVDGSLYAYFVPYTAAQRDRLLQNCVKRGIAQRESLGQTVEGRAIELLTLGSRAPDAARIWVIARLHAGESMSEWAVEGLLRRLIMSDAAVVDLLTRARLYVVPNANPDGSAVGNLRANANGIDLNRVWADPPASAPEVAHIRRAIEATGIDAFIDIHGDEDRDYLWIMHPEAVELRPEQMVFEDALKQQNPEIQYAPPLRDSPLFGSLGLSVNFASVHCGVPAWIIELPFKPVDYGLGPDSLGPAGCQRFGASLVEALLAVLAAR